MQILQEVQKSFNSIGLGPELEPFNRKILSTLVGIFPGVVSLWIFLIHEANSAVKYLESIYVVTTCSGFFICFASTIIITKKLFAFIKIVEDFVNESGKYDRIASKFFETFCCLN